MAGPIAAYYASVGVEINKKSLEEVDRFLNKVEERLRKGMKNKQMGMKFTVDTPHLAKTLHQAMKQAAWGLELPISKVALNKGWEVEVKRMLESQRFNVRINPFIATGDIKRLLRTGSAATNRVVQRGSAGASANAHIPGLKTVPTTRDILNSGAYRGLPAHIAIASAQRQVDAIEAHNRRIREEYARSRSGGGEAARRRGSITGRGDPSMLEFVHMGGRAAGNRRYLDAIVRRGTTGFLGGGGLGQMAQMGVGAAARIGAGSMLGRVGIMAGTALGGPIGGTAMGALSAMIPAAKFAWTSFFSIAKAPFSILSSVLGTVTSGFWNLFRVVAPLAGVFYAINENTQKRVGRSIAMDTIATAQGSSGVVEDTWLRGMANREGLSYESLADPYISLMGSLAPAVGMDQTRNIYEAMSQFGATRGASRISSQRAMVAISQMGGKGKVNAEELW